jgi:hypothetical protein
MQKGRSRWFHSVGTMRPVIDGEVQHNRDPT